MMINLVTIGDSLRSQLDQHSDLPCHVGAFCGWITGDSQMLSSRVTAAYDFEGQSRHAEHVAAMGFGAVDAILNDTQIAILRDEIDHLSGRRFFVANRPLGVEIDGIALIGISLAVSATRGDPGWLLALLRQSTDKVSADPWDRGLVAAARLNLGDTNVRVTPPDLCVALAAKGIGLAQDDDIVEGWSLAARLAPHTSGAPRDAVRLGAFNHLLIRNSNVSLVSTSRDDLIKLVRNVSRSLKRWTYEDAPKTRRSAIARWGVENEYHVQNLLWVILAPVFVDLEDEENLPSMGHKHPRADLCVPSLRTIIEVKFMRHTGQSAFAKVTEEVAADASFYLSNAANYDNIIAVVWDDQAQTEQHDELETGLTGIKGVSAAVVLSRPHKMRRREAQEDDATDSPASD